MTFRSFFLLFLQINLGLLFLLTLSISHKIFSIFSIRPNQRYSQSVRIEILICICIHELKYMSLFLYSPQTPTPERRVARHVHEFIAFSHHFSAFPKKQTTFRPIFFIMFPDEVALFLFSVVIMDCSHGTRWCNCYYYCFTGLWNNCPFSCVTSHH